MYVCDKKKFGSPSQCEVQVKLLNDDNCIGLCATVLRIKRAMCILNKEIPVREVFLERAVVELVYRLNEKYTVSV